MYPRGHRVYGSEGSSDTKKETGRSWPRPKKVSFILRIIARGCGKRAEKKGKSWSLSLTLSGPRRERKWDKEKRDWAGGSSRWASLADLSSLSRIWWLTVDSWRVFSLLEHAFESSCSVAEACGSWFGETDGKWTFNVLLVMTQVVSVRSHSFCSLLHGVVSPATFNRCCD